MRPKQPRRAVITGISTITAVGIGKNALWNAVLKGLSGIAPLTRFDTANVHAKQAGEINDWNPRDFLPAHRLKRLDRHTQFALVSAQLALEDASFPWNPRRPQDHVGVSFGTALGGICDAESAHAAFLSGGPKAIPHTLALTIFGGAAHTNIAMDFGFRGPGTTNSNSCASGLVALGDALRFIRDGMAEVVITGGSEAPLCPLTFTAFDLIKTMSRWQGDPPAHACRPFDALRDGFVMGEGAACLVVEELEHAQRRGAPIYAEVLGFALNNEAYHMTSPEPSGDCVVRCMRDALEDSNLAPSQIDYINCHASSTQVNDSNETRAIKTVFGSNAPAISGTKPITAHPLGATSAIESVLCVMALQHQTLPPTLHYQHSDPGCDLDIVPNQARPARIHHVLNNAFGFGGINACVALGRFKP